MPNRVTPRSSREEVKALQRMLVAAGFDIGKRGVDGEYGPATTKAVRDFQAVHGITKDGKAGPQTLGLLRSPQVPAPLPRPRPQQVTMPRVSARVNADPTINADALKQLPRQVSIGRPTMTGAFGPSIPVGQASASRPLSIREFDPLTGNSGRGVGYTQPDPGIGPFRAEAPRPNVARGLYEQYKAWTAPTARPPQATSRGDINAPSISMTSSAPRQAPQPGAQYASLNAGSSESSAPARTLAPAPRVTVPAGRGGGGAAGRATSAPYGWTTPTEDRGPLSQYSSNEVVGPNHAIWNDVHPDLAASKSSILGHSGSGTATDKIAAGALIAADAVFRAAEADGVRMTVAVGGGSNQHSKNHGKGGIGESIDIKPVGGWGKISAEKYALIASAAGANRLGVPIPGDARGLHVQVSKGTGLTGRVTTTWSYPQSVAANPTVLKALQTGNFGAVQGRPLEAQRYAARSNTYPSAEDLGIISARAFDSPVTRVAEAGGAIKSAATPAMLRPPTPPTPRTAYVNTAPNKGASAQVRQPSLMDFPEANNAPVWGPPSGAKAEAMVTRFFNDVMPRAIELSQVDNLSRPEVRERLYGKDADKAKILTDAIGEPASKQFAINMIAAGQVPKFTAAHPFKASMAGSFAKPDVTPWSVVKNLPPAAQQIATDLYNKRYAAGDFAFMPLAEGSALTAPTVPGVTPRQVQTVSYPGAPARALPNSSATMGIQPRSSMPNSSMAMSIVPTRPPAVAATPSRSVMSTPSSTMAMGIQSRSAGSNVAKVIGGPAPLSTIGGTAPPPAVVSGMTGTAANAGKLADDTIGFPGKAKDDLIVPRVPLPQIPLAGAPPPRTAPTQARTQEVRAMSAYDPQVAKLQSTLNQAGFRDINGNRLQLDGIMGDLTRSAFASYQQAAGAGSGYSVAPSRIAPAVPVPVSRTNSASSSMGRSNISPASGAQRGSVSETKSSFSSGGKGYTTLGNGVIVRSY